MAGYEHGHSSQINAHPLGLELTRCFGVCMCVFKEFNTHSCKEGWDCLKDKLILRNRNEFLSITYLFSLPALPISQLQALCNRNSNLLKQKTNKTKQTP